ncbi:hypothetical protein PYW08_011065 [Mythimna loreyi]|uniref:Uncharacterized protein n=1 Tax=Mythimna loreyi TaxID=667449 RepID=A0ACC2Q454_9NEOP|nr:hypothetical protein PYW08_011065 [Mythimna loreyi]
MQGARVLVLLALFVERVTLFSWDVVVAGHRRLEFYSSNGTLTHTEMISSAYEITSVTYDPVQYRVLFSDAHLPVTSILSYDLSTGRTEFIVTTTTDTSVRLAYEPVTQALYWKEGTSICWLSLHPASSSKPYGHVLVALEHSCHDLAVDSCGGYVYWITDYEIERARLDGSGRQVLIDSRVTERLSLAIDQPTKKMYWTERTYVEGEHVLSIKSANFNGKNETTVYVIEDDFYAFSLAVSENFIYWQSRQTEILKLSKYSPHTPAIGTQLHSVPSRNCPYCQRIATNYTIQEQIQGTNSCGALQALMPNDLKSERAASVCRNYCFQGECSVSAEGHPTCSCKPGYSGERCEVNACLDYCLHGGVCSLDEHHQRVCQCAAGYEGERCDVPGFLVKCIETVSMLKSMLSADVPPGAPGAGASATCASAGV